jgi:hypothetical protein
MLGHSCAVQACIEWMLSCLYTLARGGGVAGGGVGWLTVGCPHTVDPASSCLVTVLAAAREGGRARVLTLVASGGSLPSLSVITPS